MSDFDYLYHACRLCPRDCGINRSGGHRGFCGEGSAVRLANACLHKGEEPPLCGAYGSGTVFFSGCTLKCASCQNYQISSDGTGRTVSVEELSRIFVALEKAGAANINLVTATHFTPSVFAAVNTLRQAGSSIPVVWNSSGYENPETLALLHRFVDIYLPDMKTVARETAGMFFNRPDYPEIAKEAILDMVAAKPLIRDKTRMRQGVIVRHLVVPGQSADTRALLTWFADKLAGRALLSLLFQYLPLEKGRISGGVRVGPEEQARILRMLEEFGIEDGFFQDVTETDEWIPDFRKENPFPSEFSRPVWTARTGLLPVRDE